MTAPTVIAPMFGADRKVVKAVERMKMLAAGRDEAMNRVALVRAGELAQVWPDSFSEQYPKSMVANFIDVAARDIAAMLSSLPSLACSAGNMRTNADKTRAESKNRVGANYWRASKLQKQMKYGADQYLSYGFLPFWVEADYDRMLPIIHVEDPAGAYYELDRWFNTKRYARVWRQDLEELAALFPEYASQILQPDGFPSNVTDVGVVRYIDDTDCILYLPERSNMVIASYRHGMKRCPVHIATRPGLQLDPRGQYDDVLYVQLAKSVMAALTLEAGHKAVQAPLAVPSDMQDINIGPDALMVTDQPDKIRRVELNVPSAAFALTEQLQNELQSGAGYPDSRLGNGPAGGSTGRGISALEGGFDTQIKLGQDILGEAILIATEMCFEMEVTLWPKRSKTINGSISGESFTLTYTPATDLSADTRCEISYGFASGLSPNSAIVTLLQLRGDGIISRDTFRRQLPFDINVDQQQRELDVQQVEDGLKAGLAAMLQASGQMIAQGQQAAAAQMFAAAVQIVEGRRAGKDLTKLFADAFPAPPPPDPTAQPGMPGAPGAAGPGGEPLPGVGPNGLMQGVAAGQAGMAPGGRPSIADLAAGFTGGGAPAMSDSIHRKLATG